MQSKVCDLAERTEQLEQTSKEFEQYKLRNLKMHINTNDRC